MDDLIDSLLPHLDKGDIIIDGGNALFSDTIRRTEYVQSKGLLYIGVGVSGWRRRSTQRAIDDARRVPRCVAVC